MNRPKMKDLRLRDFVGETGLSVVGDGAHDIPKTKDLRLRDCVGKTVLFVVGSIHESTENEGSTIAIFCG